MSLWVDDASLKCEQPFWRPPGDELSFVAGGDYTLILGTTFLRSSDTSCIPFGVFRHPILSRTDSILRMQVHLDIPIYLEVTPDSDQMIDKIQTQYQRGLCHKHRRISSVTH